MKSNRMRFFSSGAKLAGRLDGPWLFPPESVSAMEKLRRMPPPTRVPKTDPDQLVEDILTATLFRVQASAKPEVAAAAARYLSLLKDKAL